MTNNEALLVGIISGLLSQFGRDPGWTTSVPIDDDGDYQQPILVETTSLHRFEVTVKEVKQ